MTVASEYRKLCRSLLMSSFYHTFFKIKIYIPFFCYVLISSVNFHLKNVNKNSEFLSIMKFITSTKTQIKFSYHITNIKIKKKMKSKIKMTYFCEKRKSVYFVIYIFVCAYVKVKRAVPM